MPDCFRCGGKMEYTGKGNEHLMTAELKCQRCGETFEKSL